jgi:hypothetical protein
MRFSERIGKKKVKVEIQIDSMDTDLKNGLWSIISIYFIDLMCYNVWLSDSVYENTVKAIWFSFFKEPIDEVPLKTETIKNQFRKRFFSWDYLEIYDFIDFIISFNNAPFNKNEIIKSLNIILEREFSAYRIIDDSLVPITNEQEIHTIEKALSDTNKFDLKGVNIHISEALSKLSSKTNPDYRNSIKESISAVESICQQITGDKNAELGKALKKLSSKLAIHGALEQAFTKLYGYTSDSDGIRHAMMDETNLDIEDALYMLVSCSSFINYLISKANKLGILKK